MTREEVFVMLRRTALEYYERNHPDGKYFKQGLPETQPEHQPPGATYPQPAIQSPS